MQEFNKSVGLRIAILRENLGFSREVLSGLAGISSKFLYEIECGKKGMSAYTLNNLARVLGVSADYLLTGNEEGASNGLFFCKVPEEKRESVQMVLRALLQLIQ